MAAAIRWFATGVQEGTTVTVTKGAGTITGDRLVVIMMDDETSGHPTPSTPQGVGTSWTTLSSSTTDGTLPEGQVFEWKVTDAANLPASWTFTPAGFESSAVWVVCISGLDPSSVINVGWASGTLPASPAGSRLVTAPSVSGYTGSDPILLTAHTMIVQNANPTLSTPSGMSTMGGALDGQWMMSAGFSQQLTGTGATGTKASQISLTGLYPWRAVSVVIPNVSGNQQGIVTMSGSGTLSIPASTVKVAGIATLPGIGDLSIPASQVRVTGIVTMSGVGTLLAQGSLGNTIATLPGFGTLVLGDGIITIPAGVATLPGLGALSIPASLVKVPAGPLTLPGAGTLTIAASLVKQFGQLTLPGVGTIAPAASIVNIPGAVVTMGGFGTLSAFPEGSEALTMNGIDIYSCGVQYTPDLSALLQVPAKRTPNVAVQLKHGAVRTPYKRYDVRIFPLEFWVRALNADTSPSDQPDERFYVNIDTLQRELGKESVTFEHTLPDTSIRLLDAEVLDVIDIERHTWANIGKMGITFCAVDPFWREPTAQTDTIVSSGPPVTALLDAFAGATAPMELMTIRFDGPATNPRLITSSPDGDFFVRYDGVIAPGQSVTIDTEQWVVSTAGGLVLNYSKFSHAGRGPWFLMQPGAAGSTVTYRHDGVGASTATVIAKRRYLGG